jgi:hypothetical protein
LAERTGLALSTARALARTGGLLADLPHVTASLSAGNLSFDKVRSLAATATPETDRELAEAAATLSVRELSELSRSTNRAASADEAKRSVRFNDSCRTMTAQLPPESYVEVKGVLEGAAKQLTSDGDVSWDQRLADAFMEVIRGSGKGGASGGSPYVVVAHVPLEVLTDERSELCGELEREGLISAEVVRRLACDATLVVAADDDAGHTMYEGRQRRYPSASQRREITRRDRHCRFPGCANATFVHPHHIRRWKPDRGPTDLDNLALLCDHHHHLVHSKAWTMSGNANDELSFLGPSGRVMTSRPSPLWTRASGATRDASGRATAPTTGRAPRIGPAGRDRSPRPKAP